MRFQFDPGKTAGNLKKTRSFVCRCRRVFSDPLAICGSDPDAQGEERFIAVGMGSVWAVMVVAYTWRGDEMRSISARRATRYEVKDYEG